MDKTIYLVIEGEYEDATPTIAFETEAGAKAYIAEISAKEVEGDRIPYAMVIQAIRLVSAP